MIRPLALSNEIDVQKNFQNLNESRRITAGWLGPNSLSILVNCSGSLWLWTLLTLGNYFRKTSVCCDLSTWSGCPALKTGNQKLTTNSFVRRLFRTKGESSGQLQMTVHLTDVQPNPGLINLSRSYSVVSNLLLFRLTNFSAHHLLYQSNMLVDNFRADAPTLAFRVESPNVQYTDDEIVSKYDYTSTELLREQTESGPRWVVKPKTTNYTFKTDAKVPKLGWVQCFMILEIFFAQSHSHHLIWYLSVMLVGWGGNNGSTLTAGILANKK